MAARSWTRFSCGDAAQTVSQAEVLFLRILLNSIVPLRLAELAIVFAVTTEPYPDNRKFDGLGKSQRKAETRFEAFGKWETRYAFGVAKLSARLQCDYYFTGRAFANKVYLS